MSGQPNAASGGLTFMRKKGAKLKLLDSLSEMNYHLTTY